VGSLLLIWIRDSGPRGLFGAERAKARILGKPSPARKPGGRAWSQNPLIYGGREYGIGWRTGSKTDQHFDGRREYLDQGAKGGNRAGTKRESKGTDDGCGGNQTHQQNFFEKAASRKGGGQPKKRSYKSATRDTVHSHFGSRLQDGKKGREGKVIIKVIVQRKEENLLARKGQTSGGITQPLIETIIKSENQQDNERSGEGRRGKDIAGYVLKRPNGIYVRPY